MILFNLLSVLFVLSVFHFQEIASQEDVVSIRLNRPGTKKACGVVDHKGSLIVNGTDVKPGDYPWMVALMEKKDLRGDNKYFCSGVLVSLTKVLTAAHCIQNKRSDTRRLNRDILVVLGANDISYLVGNGISIVSPSDIHIHPDWDPKNPRYDADIAVILFDYEVPYNQVIRPICLSPYNLTIDEGIVAGWGDEGLDRTVAQTTTPKQVTAPIVTNEKCFLETTNLNRISSYRTFCAGLRNGSGVCFGDSGSGLFGKEDSVYFLKGLVSASLKAFDGNCDVNTFAIYTNVDAYKSWINNPTGNESDEDSDPSDTRLGSTGPPKQPITCGIIHKPKSLVHSGNSATREEFPWTVAIFYKQGGSHIFVATGSLVSSKHVLSPGQTVLLRNLYLDNPRDVQLYFGVIDLEDVLPSTAKFVDAVQSIEHHPSNQQAFPKTANLAIMILRNSIRFNNYISPVCIPKGPINIADSTGKTAFAIGWGFDDSGTRSSMRKFAPVKIKSKQVCDRHQANQNEGTDLTAYFCAGSDGFKAAGTGDDPLYFRKSGKWDLIGLLVFGTVEKNGLRYNTPILYEDVGAYRQWIESIIYQ